MKKLMLSTMLVVLLFSLTGCEDPAKIAAIKKIALVSVTFDPKVARIDKDGKEHEGNVGFHLVKMLANDASGKKNEIDSILENLKKKLTGLDKEVLMAEDIKDNKLYVYSSKPPVYSNDIIFAKDYRLFEQDNEKITKFTNYMGIDAVAFLEYKFKEVEKNQIFTIQKKLRLDCKVTVIDKNGVVVYRRGVHVESDKGTSGFDEIASLMKGETRDRKQLDEVINKMNTKLVNMLKSPS